MKDPEITLIVPCYNEEANIQKGVLDKIGNYTRTDARFVRIIIVDDGSNDGSKKIIREKYLSSYPKFSLIENSHQGKAFAILTGIHKSRTEYVMFSDIDLATPIEEAEKLIAWIEKGFDIVIGSRSSKREGAPITRKIMAMGFILIRDIFIGLSGIKDTQCGFKIFKRESARRIIDRLQVFHDKRKVEGSSVTAGFDLEFLFLARKLKYSIKEVPVTWLHVETKNVRFFKDTVETLIDILKIKYYDITHRYRLS